MGRSSSDRLRLIISGLPAAKVAVPRTPWRQRLNPPRHESCYAPIRLDPPRRDLMKRFFKSSKGLRHALVRFPDLCDRHRHLWIKSAYNEVPDVRRETVISN